MEAPDARAEGSTGESAYPPPSPRARTDRVRTGLEDLLRPRAHGRVLAVQARDRAQDEPVGREQQAALARHRARVHRGRQRDPVRALRRPRLLALQHHPRASALPAHAPTMAVVLT